MTDPLAKPHNVNRNRRQAMIDPLSPDSPVRPANDEMVLGYLDGFDLSAPEPSTNRSHSYRHGFANARDDLCGQPRETAATLCRMADEAMEQDGSATADTPLFGGSSAQR